VAGTCGYGEGLSGSINAGNFLTSYKFYWLASQEGLCSMEQVISQWCRSQWPRGLRRRSAGRSPDEIVGSNPTGGAWMLVCCECYVLSGRGICDELITRPGESYRVWCVVVYDLEHS